VKGRLCGKGTCIGSVGDLRVEANTAVSTATVGKGRLLLHARSFE